MATGQPAGAGAADRTAVRRRQDTDRTVLKTEHPEVYTSVIRMVSWSQLAVEYVPEQVVTPLVPEMWKAPALEPDDSDVPF